MSRHRTVSLDHLADHLVARGEPQSELAKVGPLVVSRGGPGNGSAPGRQQTIIGYEGRFALLMDEFRGKSPGRFTLTLAASKALQRRGNLLRARTSAGLIAIHLLGDYDQSVERDWIRLVMDVPQGRFLVCLTPDPDAVARVVHGWAVEVREQGRVHHVMHANRTRKLRPLGPVWTDAPFGVAEWRETKDGLPPDADNASLFLHQATQVTWGEKKLQSETPVGVIFQTPSNEA